MPRMAKSSKSNFFPESVSSALKVLGKRVCGGLMLGLALWACGAMVLFDPFLDGFAVVSTFGNQSVMGAVIGFLYYFIGVVPTLFVVLCVARWGLAWLANWSDDSSPEYNFLRFFVALCVGAAGLGLIMPAHTWGGMFGAIAAHDLFSIMGNWCIAVGVAAVLVFAALASVLLHIKWVHIKNACHIVWRAVRWLLSVFHLMPVQYSEDEG